MEPRSISSVEIPRLRVIRVSFPVPSTIPVNMLYPSIEAIGDAEHEAPRGADRGPAIDQ